MKSTFHLASSSHIRSLTVALCATMTFAPTYKAGTNSTEIRLPLRPQQSVSLPGASAKTVWNSPVVIVGGGLGGTAAALAASEAGIEVCLVEETGWLGGQISSAGVSTPDEPEGIEQFGGTALYCALRNRIRSLYRNTYRVRNNVSPSHFSPGAPWVAGFGFEPKMADKALKQMAEVQIKAGRLHLFFHSRLIDCTRNAAGDTISSISVETAEGKRLVFQARYFLDATESGDLLAMAGQEGRDWVLGAESRAQTGEVDAPGTPKRNWIQPFTFPFALAYSPATRATNVLPKPADYAQIKAQQRFSVKDGCITGVFRGAYPWWTYRRIVAGANFQDTRIQGDIAMINVGANDYLGTQMEKVFDGSYADRQKFLQESRQISRAYAYWLQTECPRDDDPTGRRRGYPEFRLCRDQFDTPDGLSVLPYIREGRRIIPLRRIVEQDIVVRDMEGNLWQNGPRAAFFRDSVGIGDYAMDIHTTEHGERHAYARTRPFQIPLSALIPAHLTNLLPASHDLGTTHLTNGAYRLHPIEWNIGESAGLLAAYCVRTDATPRQVDESRPRLQAYQATLLANGIPLYWFDDVPQSRPEFASVQRLAMAGILAGDGKDRHFFPDYPVSPTDWSRWQQQVGARPGTKAPFRRAVAVMTLANARSAQMVVATSRP